MRGNIKPPRYKEVQRMTVRSKCRIISQDASSQSESEAQALGIAPVGRRLKNKRHCLYEKHSKTPLTRKYLTSVEERLRQAELRVRQMERRAQIAEAKLLQPLENSVATARQSPQLEPDSAGAGPSYFGSERSIPTAKQMEREFAASAQVIDTAGLRAFNDAPTAAWQYVNDESVVSQEHLPKSPVFAGSTSHAASVRTHELEAPPSEADDFSWDEQSSSGRPESRHGAAVDVEGDDANVTDGMASLSVEDRGAGYLGTASGAAMLRLLLPDAEHRRPVKQSLQSRLRALSSQQSDEQPHQGWVPTPVWEKWRIGEIDLDVAINSYFSLYHLSYPIVHEPTFRAQYTQVIPRPSGSSWNALAYMLGALGLFTASTGYVTRDLDLFEAAKANISIDSLGSGNLTLVQVLVLMSNYLQKRNKPNSGYNYLGLALHMAMGLGLHKEFHNWRIAPLAMEIRRRVWWCLHVFAVGAMITFGRPLSWPVHGIEVALPINVDDRDLTNVSTSLPSPRVGITTYSAVAAQARFHLATNDIYSKVISVNFPSASELLQLDEQRIESWRLLWHNDHHDVPLKFRLSRSIMEWRFRNFRVIMYRPFVIRHVLQLRSGAPFAGTESTTQTAIERCFLEAKLSIRAIHEYWMSSEQAWTVMAAWYALYFLFQSSLVPLILLRNQPTSAQAPDWGEQIHLVLNVLDSMADINPASRECRQVITKLCTDFLPLGIESTGGQLDQFTLNPVEESPQTQLSGVYSMMWPSANAADVDTFIPDNSWTAFLVDAQSNSPFLPRELTAKAPWG
ncbi:hypothetical protein LTR36_001009 [Oleoguttula mirabilis]|uniref:Xylanolytic transcriptional activator regulatory domain-containing protein n=1 Tax=Oleoguttula mirabilis TaxID=1507867 RepID=A0AAV9JPP3_9PEZI|nr:hypothetical protein LTR36_001009 [Oleoguttula mirabilis]